MAEALIMEYAPEEGIDPRAQYDAVLKELGLAEGEVPDGGISHVAALSESGTFVIFEVWESRAAQERFFTERLGAALERGGARTPSRMEWLDVVGAVTAPSS